MRASPADPLPAFLLAVSLLFASPLTAGEREPLPSGLTRTLEASRSAPQALAVDRAARQWRQEMAPRLALFVPVASQRDALLLRVHDEARLAGLPPALVLAVIEVESGFDPEAISPAGAVGLMQVMPFWVRELGRPADDLAQIGRNLRYGCTILAHYLAVEGGDLTRALARYNGSLGQSWYPERVMRAWRERWR